jgi:predicted lipoprotein with Yx(FWY)xxD motif
MAAAVAAPAVASAPRMSAHQGAAHEHERTEISTRRTSLGRVVANTKGRVMYMFLKDGRKVSHCHGVCASVWPHVTSKGRPRAEDGIKGKHLSRTATGQVTYYGHPLYYFVSGKKPGSVAGEGLNHFFVVSTHGKPIRPKPATSPGATTAAVVTSHMAGTADVLASKNGHTLYELSPQNEAKVGFDCTGSCTTVWRPLLSKGKPVAKGDAMQSLLGTVKRPNSTTQVTYKGFPVYDYTGDTSAGQTNGEALLGPAAGQYQTQDYWYDIDPATGAAS